jgi:hypothetical protein
MNKRVIIGCLSFALLVGFGATSAVADPNLTLTTTAHRHFVLTGNGQVEVGPRYCDNPALLGAFTQFHANTHTHNGVTGEIGPVAPGLHNTLGPELSSGPC